MGTYALLLPTPRFTVRVATVLLPDERGTFIHRSEAATLENLS
jgi:hypothetical protein